MNVGVDDVLGHQVDGATEAVQHRHAADDGDLVLVDVEGENDALASAAATPNTCIVPPGRTRVSASSIAGITPVQSTTTSHPCGRSKSSALLAVHRLEAAATSSRAVVESTTDTLAAGACASWAIISPIVPAP